MIRKQALARLTLPVGHRDHIQGPVTAPVTLVEFGDFECPLCGQAYNIVKNLQASLGRRLRFVFRHFPLTRVHPHAQQAAEAAEAAGVQRKFWEMHDLLFEHQDALEDDHLAVYAATLGLDLHRFSSELATHTHVPRVREDFLSGVASGVNGTPTFFINGVRHDDSYDYEILFEAIEAAESETADKPE